MYPAFFQRYELEAEPFPDQEFVSDVIEMVKQSRHDAALAAECDRRIRALTGVDGVVLGCTEFASALPALEGLPVSDSNHALAEYCIAFVKGSEPGEKGIT